MKEYAQNIGANAEVIAWCDTVLAAYIKKQDERHPPDVGEIEHVIDFLASDRAPARLRKMSYAQAKAAADRWSKANQKKGRNLVDGPEDIETVHDFLDGTRIVKLLTKKAYEREGFFMAHCVGGYNPDSATIYSYRDKNNEPHATFEVTSDGKSINQIKGKGNGPIHPRYIHPILTFLQTIGMKVRPHDMKNLGYIHISAEAEKVLSYFADTKGQGPVILPLLGERYMAASQ